MIHTRMKLALQAACVAALATLGLWPVAAQAPGLALLDRLTPGQWELRDRSGAPTQRICVKSGRQFIQLRHRGQSCKRIAIENSPNQVTVQFTCRMKGYGRTSIRRESPSLVQIEGQGISNKNHYEFAAEARRISGC
ncbi:MAG: DUF3617 family protein [Pontixanthobacter sp.]